ncbi:multicopper oxidase family protein [Trinickia dinghuensis]|uniref:Copper oxidase n=1 Tax=Trinickia dinghuensis TaxID=2291023 RepID=A0A3D8JSC0_9BURK|nr:multicopper oxidase domain-containing protein [Trinickia dinghuensis]RDU95947.1 copper oxidase [Trinickia dinghuensis]
MRLFTRLIAAVAACASLSLCTLAFAAPGSARSFVDLEDTSGAAAPGVAQPLTRGTQVPSIPARCSGPGYVADASHTITLDAGYSSYSIYNPSTNAYDQVKLRAYDGCPTGPTINVDPGQTLKVRLNNKLPPESATTCPPNAAHDSPHCFNTINLHTHGMHVSPSGNSDNVFISVPPGGSANYVYQIPADHPAGTFWYHAHHHGSVAIDAASGMEGVLIVRGHRTAARRVANGGMADIDTILHDRRGVAFPEHVFLFQQIEYGCFANAQATAPLADPTTFQWICPTGSVGEIRNYTNQLNFIADPRPGHAGEHNSTWEVSGRYTQINGVVQPLFPSASGFLPAGQIQRWRLVHGGDRDTINLKVVQANLAALGRGNSAALSAQDVDAATDAANALLAGQHSRTQRLTTLEQLCSGEVVKQIDIADDGLTRNAMVEQDVTTLDPGYRRDVLTAFPKPGLYCMLDEGADASTTIAYRPGASKVKDRRLLAFVRVGPGNDIPDYAPDGLGHSKYWQYVRNSLVDANRDLPPDVLANLRMLDTQAYAPHKPLVGPINKQVPMLMNIGFANGAAQFTMNGQSYDPSRIDYTGVLGTTDEWHITAGATGGHVFHIHVNPFEIVDILDPHGVSIYDSSGHCTAAEIATGDQEYCALHDAFVDTIFVKPGYTVVMRTQYKDFTGEFVMHCHILDHEDAGMMGNVQIVTPTTALISRIATPLARAKADVDAFVDALRYGRQRPTQLAFTAPICGAGNVETIVTK